MLKKSLFYLIMFGFVFLVLETFAWLLTRMVDVDGFFDHRAGVLERINDEDMSAFLQARGDPVLGWEYRGPEARSEKNCIGEMKDYSYDATGARLYTGYDRNAVRIIVVGDSYTNSDEVNDDEAYPAQLATILGSSVANHGVGGYGPAQSFVGLTEKIQLYPDVEVVILAVMYENLYRMMNSYRPVLYDKTATYGLKPYMAGGEVKPHPGKQAFANAEVFKRYADRAFDNDFWSKPAAAFPYSYSLLKALGSNYFYYRKFQKHFRRLGIPEYFLLFRSQDIATNLFSVMNRFAEFATSNGVRPVVVFIPRNHYDVESASRFIEENSGRFHQNLLVGDVARADVDWQRFNLQETDSDNICHPSAYGYRKIAEYIADLLHQGGAWSP